MVIYAFLKWFKFDSQRHVNSRSRQSDQNHKHLSHTTKLQLVKCNKKLIKAKQGKKDMLCENKLTNLIFKTKKIMQNTICFLFLPSIFFFFLNLEKKNKNKNNLEWNAWILCNANPRNKENKKPKNDGHNEYSNETQGPCQKDSIRLSLLHPKLFRCTSSIGVLIHMRMITNSKIGIKV